MFFDQKSILRKYQWWLIFLWHCKVAKSSSISFQCLPFSPVRRDQGYRSIHALILSSFGKLSLMCSHGWRSKTLKQQQDTDIFATFEKTGIFFWCNILFLLVKSFNQEWLGKIDFFPWFLFNFCNQSNCAISGGLDIECELSWAVVPICISLLLWCLRINYHFAYWRIALSMYQKSP